MAISNRFKKTEAYPRAQFSEEFYLQGLNYTDQPLREGVSRMLVNFDFKANQGPLIPRPGVRTNVLGVQALSQTGGSPALITHNITQSIMTSRICPEGPLVYGQVIVSDLASQSVDAASKLIKAKGYAMTIQPEDTYLRPITPGPVNDVQPRELHSVNLAGNNEFCYYRVPERDMIHGMAVTNPTHWLVGAFAYGNSFYYFKNKAGGDRLCRTIHDSTTKAYKAEELTAKVLTPKEAVLWGYNMLSDTPYTFANTNYAGNIQLLGVLPYDGSGNLIMSPLVNQNITLTCYYAAPVTIKHTLKWEWREPGSSSWTSLKEELVDTGALAAAKCETSFPVAEAIVRITATEEGSEDPVQVILIGFNFNKEAYGSTANADYINYTLSKAKGMSFWNHRLVVYAPPEGKNMVFVSEVNDPEYFAYPHGAEIFPEDVIYVCPFMDDLLVFTVSALYMMVPSADGLSWTVTKVQGDLNIAEQDIHLITTVKNMLYFKSGNYYFMVVPSVKTKIGLALTPISNNITNLLDRFETGLNEIMFAMYNYKDGVELVTYNNHLDYHEIHNNYIIREATGRLINFDLIYSTVTRSWRFYMHEVPGVPSLYNRDAANRGELITLMPIYQRILVNDVPQNQILTCIQTFEYDIMDNEDWYIPPLVQYFPALPGGIEDETTDVDEWLETEKLYKNFQYLDTGNREHNTDLKKRYREVQIKINNVSKRELYFYIDFYIDGGRRQSSYKYEIQHETDPSSEGYGLIYVERVLDEDSRMIGVAPGVTILAEDQTQTHFWTLSNSMFPDVNFWKIRIPVSGKGYTPRMIFVSANELPYEVLSNSWVYKEMYSR